MQRTSSSIKNLIFAFIGQAAGIVMNFIARVVFLRILTAEYLGLNGLFTNILSMLSLMELGVGTAMTFSLYKPLATSDKEKIKSLMNLYRKSYIIIGILVLVIGIGITPLLPYFIDEVPKINENINLIYILFVINTAISYFYSYKRSLISSDQKRYIATAYRYIFYCLLNIMQIIILLLTKNYIWYLITQIIFTFAENVAISKKADKLYPYLKEKNINKLEKEDTEKIKKNVVAMIGHKIGGIIVGGTDNIILSKFVGLVEVGIYSNYYLIINALNVIIGQVFTAITASVGNLVATTNKQKVYDIFKKVFFLDFWLYAFSSICLLVLFNRFITIWIGNEYLFSMDIVLILVINFYITGMRKAFLTFRDATGLYWADRYKPFAESIINIIASIILVKMLGTIGVFIGTFISTITTCFWVEPYILYKYEFGLSIIPFLKKYILYTILMIIAGIITVALCNLIKITGIIGFIINACICIIVINTIFLIFLHRTEEFKYFKNLILDFIKNRLKKYNKCMRDMD